MGVFDNDWLHKIYCILNKLDNVDVWTIHRVFYELSRENIIKIDSWKYYGESPRSAEVDAALAFFEMINAIKIYGDIVRVVKKPRECVMDQRVEEIISRTLKG